MALAGKTFVTATSVMEPGSRPARAAARSIRSRTSANRSRTLTAFY
jgi:hypothetical protein